MQAARRLSPMEVDGEGVPWWRDGQLRQDAPDFAAMIAAVESNVDQHFLPCHAALVTVGEGEGDGFVKMRRRKDFEIVQVPSIARRDGRAQIAERRRLLGVVGIIAVARPDQMRREYPSHHMAVVEQSHGGMPIAFVPVQAREFLQQLVVGPGLIGKEAVEQGQGTHRFVSFRRGKCEYVLYIFMGMSKRVYSHCKIASAHAQAAAPGALDRDRRSNH